jgi:HEAT repeat protein
MRASEPTHDGRSLTEWLARMDSLTLDEEAEAFAAIQSIGTNALPTIIALLGKKNGVMAECWRRLIESVPFVGVRFTPAEVWRRRARVALILVGEQGEQSVSISQILRLLRDDDAGVRLTAVEVLRNCMFNVESAIGALESAQTDPDNTVRKVAQDAVQTYRGVKGAFTSDRLDRQSPFTETKQVYP